MSSISPKVLVKLTNAPTASGWQENNREQFVGDDIFIFISPQEPFMLREIQQSARKIEELGIEQVQLTGDLWDESKQWAFALGFSAVDKFNNVSFCGDEKLVKKLDNKLAIYGWSRDITNQTPSNLVPEKLAAAAEALISRYANSNITATVIAGEALAEAGLTGIYNVGKGSINPPCLLALDFNPLGSDEAPVSACLVGKGITFDSGGYSIKSSAGMFNMKCDMGGAAIVTGALALAISQGLNKRVKLFLCCAENLVSSNAFKLGDILTYKNGVTVEIANTDAEGRLVLADGLILADETKAPLIIDAATLTGAAMQATGGEYTALFTMDNALADKTMQLAGGQDEPLWRLPLAPWHQEKCSSAFADTANSSTQKGGAYGGASNAAGFLSRFLEQPQQGWLHFDLAASYHGNANSLWAAGGTGLGISTIAELLLNA